MPFIRHAEKSMLLEFDENMPAAAQRDSVATMDLWDTTKAQDHADTLLTIASKLADRKATMDDFGRVKNMAIRWGGNVLVAGKRVDNRWAVVVGAAGCYITTVGADKLMCAKHASMEWTDSICQKVRQEVGAAVMDGWEDNLNHLMMRRRRGRAAWKDLSHQYRLTPVLRKTSECLLCIHNKLDSTLLIPA